MIVLGTDDDPLPSQETLKRTMGSRSRGTSLKDVCQAVGVSTSQDLQVIASDLRKRRAKVLVQHRPDRKSPQYTNATFVGWFAPDQGPALEVKPVPPQGQPAGGPVPMPPGGAARSTVAAPRTTTTRAT